MTIIKMKNMLRGRVYEIMLGPHKGKQCQRYERLGTKDDCVIFKNDLTMKKQWIITNNGPDIPVKEVEK